MTKALTLTTPLVPATTVLAGIGIVWVATKLVIAPVLQSLLAPPQHYDRVLVSIPYSHFVESARWAMERRDLKINEIKLPVGPHATVVAFFRLLFDHGVSSRSSYVGQGFSDSWIPTMTNTRLRRLAAVPLVIDTRTKSCLPDSWAVLADCRYSVCDTVRDRWDQDLGPSVRQAGYYYIFQNKRIYRSVQSCHPFWMFFHDFLEHTLQITWFMKRMMFMTPEQVAQAEERILAEFHRVSQVLEKYAYLGDGTGSAVLGGADIAFSALSGWLILPKNFHNGHVLVPNVEILPDNMQAFMNRLSNTKAAKHVHHCYEQRSAVVKD